jgi:anti-sigma regulatory factor (Ser/Thr protein kinase)
VAERPPSLLELQPGSMSSVSAARRFVRNALARRVPASVSADLELATSELVTNALEHGAHVPVQVSVDVDDRSAWVTIESGDGASLAEVEQWAIAGAERANGRGLGIVRAIADDVDVRRTSTSVSITVHRHL